MHFTPGGSGPSMIEMSKKSDLPAKMDQFFLVLRVHRGPFLWALRLLKWILLFRYIKMSTVAVIDPLIRQIN